MASNLRKLGILVARAELLTRNGEGEEARHLMADSFEPTLELAIKELKKNDTKPVKQDPILGDWEDFETYSPCGGDAFL